MERNTVKIGATYRIDVREGRHALALAAPLPALPSTLATAAFQTEIIDTPTENSNRHTLTKGTQWA